MSGEDMKDEESNNSNSNSNSNSVARRSYSRSVSWTDRSPSSRKPPQPPSSNKPRPLLPALQPLSINKRSALEEWPSAGSDDLGVWPLPQTPRGSIRPCDPANDFQLKRDKLAFFDKECSRIAEHIYLGSDTVARNHELLREKGITHVLNCVGFVCPEYFKSDLVYKTLWLQDSPSEDITSILYDVFDYFEDVRGEGGRVLVHCCQGVSRSSSLVIAYLMWREGQSFEDAFQYVKNARGVTNPNMGFACQLLQCQKRVHATPASPNSVLRMYRMVPHSPHDPLHLVPKMVNHPSAQALDSRGAFLVHVPSAIYVWNGKHCCSEMSCNARGAASQVVRYERAKGPILTIHEGQEPPQFWIALSDKQGEGPQRRKVDAYDSDFEIFHKAAATCLPSREHGWGILRRKLASGHMKELLTSPEFNCDASDSSDRAGASNPFPCYLSSIPKSPTLSPSSSDYASSFTFSPSSTNWSDLSFVSSSQPSPSGLESTEPLHVKDASFSENFSLFHNGEVASSHSGAFLANNNFLPLKGTSLSIAERRGSNMPPRMLLSAINESSHVHNNLVRSLSLSLPHFDDDDDDDDDNVNGDSCNADTISPGVESE